LVAANRALTFMMDGELTSAVQCNCSICARSGFLHWRIEREQLRILTPWEHLSSYILGTGKARHFFCPVCESALLRVPLRNPAQCADIRCLEGVDISKVVRSTACPHPLQPMHGWAAIASATFNRR